MSSTKLDEAVRLEALGSWLPALFTHLQGVNATNRQRLKEEHWRHISVCAERLADEAHEAALREEGKSNG